MGKRKCVFTGLEATTKMSVIPKTYSEDSVHNWANKVPCNLRYLQYKGDRLPDKLELEAVEFFHLLELAKLKTDYYQNKLREIQQKLRNRLPKQKLFSKKKQKEIDNAIKIKEVLETVDEHIEKTLNEDIDKVKGLWDK